MDKYRKKPVEVEAYHYEGSIPLDWTGPAVVSSAGDGTGACLIETREGTMRAELGDWIIKEPHPTEDRRFYPCKPDIFEATYEPVVPQ